MYSQYRLASSANRSVGFSVEIAGDGSLISSDLGVHSFSLSGARSMICSRRFFVLNSVGYFLAVGGGLIVCRALPPAIDHISYT